MTRPPDGPRSLFRPLLPTGVWIAEGDPRLADPATLLPAEAAYVRNAVDKRRREFAATRALARPLLASLGHAGPLLPGPDRAPEWPSGVVGSITHTDTGCAVAIAPAGVVSGLGIDVEAALPLPAGVGSLVLDDREVAALPAAPPALRGCADRAIFSAKEAAYKAIYPAVRRVLGFEAMHVRLEIGGTFTAELRESAGPYPPGSVLRGTWAVTSGLIGTVVALER